MKNVFPLYTLKNYLKKFKKIEAVHISGIIPSALAFAIDNSIPFLKENILVIVKSQSEAEYLKRNLEEIITIDHGEEWQVLLFSINDSSPYDEFLPSKEMIGDRVKSLDRLLYGKRKSIIIAPVMGISRYTIPPDIFKECSKHFKSGEEVEVDDFLEFLVTLGYERVTKVENVGEFSIRGGISDIYLSGYKYPIRIEFFGDEIESIKKFDPIDQRTFKEIEEFTILPVSELIVKKEDSSLLEKLNIREEISGENREFCSQGYEKFMPAFYGNGSTILDYIDDFDVVLYNKDEIIDEYNDRISSEIKLFNKLKKDEQLFGYDSYYTALENIINGRESIVFSEVTDKKKVISMESMEISNFSGKLSELIFSVEKDLRESKTIFLFLPSVGQLKRLKDIFLESKLGVNPYFEKVTKIRESHINLIQGNFLGGFSSDDERIKVITAYEIYGKNYRYSRGEAKLLKKSRAIYNLSELNIDDYVVHTNYGIGQYKGINTLTVQGRVNDYIHIEYAKSEKLFIPCENINLIHKYIGMDENEPKLNSLSDNSWKRAKSRAKKSIDSLASELVKLYATRMKVNGYAFPEDDELQQELDSSFPFNDTQDQAMAIRAVKEDMISDKPMDRLVCGDVGYGKTEVAVRAAFKAICGSKQVAVLVPTTILAMQHYNTFSSRFSTFPVRVELLSRFRSKSEQKEVLKDLKSGVIDLVIGTHRILQKDVVFKDLGLLVVDEEQRFGVKHKERIKQLRENIDILTLTATPIPRTLYLSLTGARDMSLINTPPADRLPVKTIVRKYDDEMIKKAIKYELSRGGQIYYVHNRVKSIDLIAMKLKKLVPEAKIRTAHGQMDEKSLEKIMLEFYERSYDILVSTTIIENGLDIPTVNTIIIERADTFGLSQLYQLRGRVGRSKHQAFAYFLYPEDKVLTRIAKKRLQTIKECSELGSGYKIAMRDLEIRGAGNLLGYRQHGQIHQVGFEMYCKLLKEAVENLKGNENNEYEIEIEMKMDASIPATYISDSEQKIYFYQKMASIRKEEEADEISDELIDRFGPLPKRVKLLLEIARLRGICRKLMILSLKEERDNIIVKFHEEAVVEPERLSLLLKFYKSNVRFVPGDNILLYIKKDFYRGENLISLIRDILGILKGKKE